MTPALLLAVATGVGLGVRRLAAGCVPGALVPGVGFAALALLGWALALIAAELIAPGLVIAALAGLVAGRAALRTPDSGAVAVGGMAFVLFAAPVVLSGEATIAGYIKLDDTATWLALADRVLDQGPDTTGLSASTYEATLAVNFENGYPFGGFVPLGAVTRISGVDLAWAFQPYLALIGALLALALWQLGGALVRSRPLRIVSAVGASQAALLVGFYLWGGVKELAVAMLVATACALAADGAGRPGWRPLLAPIVAGAAVVPFASPAGLVWLVPVAAGVLLSRLRHGARPVAVAVGTAAVAAAVAVVVFPGRQLGLGRGSYTNENDLGNLAGALDPLQALGVWPAADFRFDPPAETLTALALGLLVVGAVWGTLAIVRARAMAVGAYCFGAVVVAAAIWLVASPWLDAKALAIATPAALFLALLGFSSLTERGHRVAGLSALGVALAAVAWSAVAQWGGVSLAPRAQFDELRAIAGEISGEGPTLMTEYSPYGARYFLRDADPESVSELRRRSIPLAGGGEVEKGRSTDTDLLDPDALAVYRTLVLRRSPAQSRPPSPYRLTWQGEFYEAWQRPATRAALPRRLALGSRSDPVAEPNCRAVRDLAGGASELIAAASANPVSMPLSEAEVVVERPGGYEVWLAGSVRSAAELMVDGEPVREIRHELNNSGQYVSFGEVPLERGTHRIEFRLSGADLHPGSGGSLPVGPIALTRGEAADSKLVRVPASAAGRLCGRAWDWIEARR